MNRYSSYTPDQLEEHFSNFLISSWSYSKVSTFSRNEKAFEKEEIYGERPRKSASTIAGNAYHEALREYFAALKEDGEEKGAAELQETAWSYIEGQPANSWKTQKTTPTVEQCRAAAAKQANALVTNFLSEKDAYSEIVEILGVELPLAEWLVINGVDIPLPCRCVIDLVGRTADGRTVVVDHKSKRAYTTEEELSLTRGKQAITYAAAYESRTGTRVDEAWFVENKASSNKDGSPQLRCYRIALDDDTRKLYEAMLYEPLKRMLEAVSDPDYVYVINDSDSLSDKGELYEFWTKTMIAEVDDFHVREDKKELVRQRLRKIRDSRLAGISPRAITSFRRNAASFISYDFENLNMTNKEKIEHALRAFGVIVKAAHEIDGYSSSSYLLELSAGTKASSIAKYRLDMANALDVPDVRVMDRLTVYGGKSYVCVECPRKRTETLAWDEKYLDGTKIPIGIDNFGNTVAWDLDDSSTPHMLVCGGTGSGKSVCLLSTMRYAQKAGIGRIIVMDPKYEFVRLDGQGGVRVYNDIADIETQTAMLVKDMQSRARSGRSDKTLVVFDEFADAVSSARSGAELDIREKVLVGQYKDGRPKYEEKVTGRMKSLEENLRMLLQKGRSLGFRIVAATQRASAKVITGDAKVNFPVLVCFRVPKEIDSKVVLDEGGAQSLQGHGDGLMKSPALPDTVRFQGFFCKE